MHGAQRVTLAYSFKAARSRSSARYQDAPETSHPDTGGLSVRGLLFFLSLSLSRNDKRGSFPVRAGKKATSERVSSGFETGRNSGHSQISLPSSECGLRQPHNSEQNRLENLAPFREWRKASRVMNGGPARAESHGLRLILQAIRVVWALRLSFVVDPARVFGPGQRLEWRAEARGEQCSRSSMDGVGLAGAALAG